MPAAAKSPEFTNQCDKYYVETGCPPGMIPTTQYAKSMKKEVFSRATMAEETMKKRM